jgi:hypothetical protein
MQELVSANKVLTSSSKCMSRMYPFYFLVYHCRQAVSNSSLCFESSARFGLPNQTVRRCQLVWRCLEHFSIKLTEVPLTEPLKPETLAHTSISGMPTAFDAFYQMSSNIIKIIYIYTYIYIYFDSWSARLFAKAVNDSCLSQSCRFWRCSRVWWPLLILDILVDSAPFVWAATFAVRHDLSEMINRSYYTAIYDILWCNVWWSMM